MSEILSTNNLNRSNYKRSNYETCLHFHPQISYIFFAVQIGYGWWIRV